MSAKKQSAVNTTVSGGRAGGYKHPTLEKRRHIKDHTLMWLFVLPVLVLLIVINAFPLVWSLFLSFCDYTAKMANVWGKNPEFLGAANYHRILHDPEMWEKFTITAKYVAMTVTAEMLLGFGIALVLQLDFKGRGVITTLLVLPMTMSPVIVGLMWRLFLSPTWGVFNFLLGLPKIDWISNPNINLYSIVMADVWMWTPFVMLLSLAGLGSVPKYLYEAAEIDRASWWFKFTRITLPTIYPILMIALIFRTIRAFKIFDLPMGITGRGAMAPPLLSMHLYNVSFVTWQTSYGASIGYIMLIMIIAITSIFIKYLNKAREE
ncbi:MAG: carbohydrate ABC transporter permease [Spirochaetota bacterium]